MKETAALFWNNKKEKLKSKYPVISDNDLNYCEGKEREMLWIIGNKLGKTEKEILDIILWL
jgi:hypothetical protein